MVVLKGLLRSLLRGLWVIVFGLSLLGVVATTTGCAGAITAAEAKALNPQIALITICVKPLKIGDGVVNWAENALTRAVVTDREPEKLRHFIQEEADFFFTFAPNEPQTGLEFLPDDYQGVRCHLPMLSFGEVEELRARRPAHFMGERVRQELRKNAPVVRRNVPFLGNIFVYPDLDGSSEQTIPVDHPSAPEGYTVNGLPGKMPYQFHLGYAAHRVIAEHYEVTHPGHPVFKNYTNIMTIVRKAGGNEKLVRWYEADLRPDITDMDKTLLFEIKPRGDQHLAEGKKKVAQYLDAINVAMVGGKLFTPGLGYKGELGIRFKDGISPWNLVWDTTAPGVVQYSIRVLDVDDKDKEKAEAYQKAYEEGRWRDLTTQEMAQHAEEMHVAVETMLRMREYLANLRTAMTLPITGVGVLAEFVLSAQLWSDMNGTPKFLPVLRKPALAVRPPPIRPAPSTLPKGNAGPQAPPPSPITVHVGPIQRPKSPAVNARPLGSDKAPSKAAHPSTPQKTNPTPN